MKEEFILVSSKPIRDLDIVDKLKEIEGVTEVYSAFGFHYDIIIKVESESMEGLRRIERKVRRTPGAKMVLTMLVRD